jgi:glycosyltransferase involved in cell wall biosynthesis
VSQENGGPGSARYHGVRLAQSPLVTFLDGDDTWSEGYLKENVQWIAPERT